MQHNQRQTTMATDKTVKTIFPVLGMSCAACAARVEKVLAHQPGVYAARINYAAANAAVEYDPARTAPDHCAKPSAQRATTW